jgi:putative NADPH-quinone reductase
MGKFITIIQGHPDAQTRHFCHALADEYAKGCEDGGHEVRRIEVARLEFPLLRTKDEFEKGTPPDSIKQAQDAIRWADHLVIFYPLWLGSMPALLKAFLEQVFRPGVAFQYQAHGNDGKEALHGEVGSYRGDHGYAGIRVSMVFSGSQREEPRTEHSRLLRDQAGESNLDRSGGRHE